jgi:hypothetical protein
MKPECPNTVRPQVAKIPSFCGVANEAGCAVYPMANAD